ncbi:MAG: hypothetical protein AMXMBFR23_18650 [Chloroflexota bacterium]
MAIYSVDNDASLTRIDPVSLTNEGWKERADLQRLLRDAPDVIESGVFIVAEEFGNWENSQRRIDLLGIDSSARLVVIELKRTDDGGHMELQALRYAAMVANMTFEQLVEAHADYLARRKIDADARIRLLEHPPIDPQKPEVDSSRPRIVLVSGGFSPELTTSVLWLNERDLDIRCVRVQLFKVAGQTILDADQIIPLPEAQDYIVQRKKKAAESDPAAFPDIPWTSEDIHQLRPAIGGNATLVALLDLCAERPGEWVGLSEATARGGQSPAQARGALGGLTTLIRARFKRGGWPIEYQWNAGGGGQSYYRMTSEIASWWKESAPLTGSSAPPEDPE